MRWLLVLLLVASCGGKQQCPVAPPTTAKGAPFLWRVQKGGDVVWLYGTIHDAGLDAVPKSALDALDASPRLVSELGEQEPDRDEFREHARIKSGPGIDQQLSTDDWYDLRDSLIGKVKEDDLRRAKPWYAMSLLTTYLAPSPGPSMDVQLAERAQDRKQPIEHLETWVEQLSALETAVDIKDLQEAIHARATMKCDLGRLRSSYEAGDIEVMTALLVVPKTEAVMLKGRNQKWLPTIEGYFAKGGAFIAVGLGHLLGDNGLVVLLQRAGYTVERTTTR